MAARTVAHAALGTLLLAAASRAEQLPLRRYGVADGLAHTQVHAIHQDRQGYLWFATAEGVSRFDGYRFTTYGTAAGLPHPLVNALAEDREGRIWIGTNGGGVARFLGDGPSPGGGAGPGAGAGGRKWIAYPVGEPLAAQRVNALLFDAQDTLWCATDQGLYRAPRLPDDRRRFEAAAPHAPIAQMMGGAKDHRGHLWFGLFHALAEVKGGRVVRHAVPEGPEHDEITAITEDARGRLVVAFTRRVVSFPPEAVDHPEQWSPLALDLPAGQKVYALLEDSEQTLWLGTRRGLIRMGTEGVSTYTAAAGLGDDNVYALAEDREGDLWVGTLGGGLAKLSREGLVSFTRADGLPEAFVVKVVEARNGHIYGSTLRSGLFEVVGGRARSLPGSQQAPFDTVGARFLQDRHGDWWVGTEKGLFKFRGPELRLQNARRFTARDGFDVPRIGESHGLYEDPRGTLWIMGVGKLYHLEQGEKGEDRFREIPPGHFPADDSPTRLLADRAGDLWLASFKFLSRWRGPDEHWFTSADGLPDTQVRALFQDRRGRLWLGFRYHGLAMTEDPSAPTPRWVRYSTREGLASDTVWAIAEDGGGRIYAATGRGLDQLDPATGRIRHYTTADGLAGDSAIDVMTDSKGDVWVATSGGLSRLRPHVAGQAAAGPPVYLTRVEAAGVELALPEPGLGLGGGRLTLGPSQDTLLVEYVGLSYRGEQSLRYQYRLEGMDDGWSAPVEQRAVRYAHLAPGSYLFQVRAMRPDGTLSAAPATLRFRLLAPLWRRGWFVALAGVLAAALVYLLHRGRVARLVALERVRTRIASDLHDDIGANLSRVALLSEVLRQQGGPARDASERLSAIAGICRETVDAMGDIVWAVDPRRDRLQDLVQRMRRFADDTCSARDITLRFRAPADAHALAVNAELRRQAFLVFKESLNNAVRHSGCGVAQVDLRLDDGSLVLTVEDDGHGFDPGRPRDGNGLDSMARRAQSLGGRLEVSSAAGRGTTVRLRAPLRPRRRSRQVNAQ